MAEAIDKTPGVGRRIEFLDEHKSLYAGGARVWSQNVLPIMFRTARYNYAVWGGGIPGSNPGYDPENDANTQPMFEAQAFVRQAGALAVIGQEAIEHMSLIVPVSRVRDAIMVRYEAIKGLLDHINNGEGIYILPQHEVDRGCIHPSSFSLATGADNVTRYITEVGAPGSVVYEGDRQIADMEQVFEFARSQAMQPDESAAYLGPIVAGYEAGIKGQTGSQGIF